MPKRPVTSEQPPGVSATILPRNLGGPAAGVSGEGHPSGLAIIASKIAPEPPGRGTLTRERLVGWLEQQASARVVVLSAEAGYGKSTLLGEFARRSAVPCVWYRMEG
jgi:LuxR family maltose regulon positive regulatory protein